MSIRYYLSGVVGDGQSPATGFRPRAHELLPGVEVHWIDGRPDVTVATGSMFAWADVTVPEHQSLVADAAITYLPFEDFGGNVLELTHAVSQIAAANRTAIESLLDGLHIPTDDFVGTDLIRKVVRRIALRFLVRQLLGSILDFAESLGTLVASVPAQRRAAINTRLAEVGFDMSLIFGTDTIGVALRKLFIQSNKYLKTILD